MKLINLKCSNCGANLTVIRDLKKCTCNFCGSTTLIDDEIIKVEYKIIDNKKEELYKKIDGLLELKYYKNAETICEELVREYPYEARAWFYMVKTHTKDFQYYSVDLDEIEEYYNNYIELEKDDDEYKKNSREYKEFTNKIKSLYDDENNVEGEIQCPYCSKTIVYGERVCGNCDELLYWPK